ncbi:guanitoxin biosynthesis heme-dependent pre-guanitoxin N-hydroxylase GntA [Asticcacaulis solisilvae]|uniref:guanitoxin biosynthesis heme-dependent pre-guanitoxin N-hydroxylase GntA n=1 Tax=Asticcacaulis solisilvae TaxID=1217274 RepID=UPI003FD7A9B5
MYHFPESQTGDATAEAGLVERFEAHIKHKAFPCVGAKSALSRGQIQTFVAGDIRCPRDDAAIHDALCDFVQAYRDHPGPFQTFAVLFPTADTLSEAAFEQFLWQRLKGLRQTDAARGCQYDGRVSADIGDARFSLSFGGEAFFVVGLHPGASRPARRFETPVLVFNAHDQFERLRADGRYETLRDAIIARDVALAGSPNAMLARHGEVSEARQYSGRQISGDWTCPVSWPA